MLRTITMVIFALALSGLGPSRAGADAARQRSPIVRKGALIYRVPVGARILGDAVASPSRSMS